MVVNCNKTTSDTVPSRAVFFQHQPSSEKRKNHLTLPSSQPTPAPPTLSQPETARFEAAKWPKSSTKRSEASKLC